MSITPLTAEEYHADPAPSPSLSASIASILLNQSARHAWLAHPRLNPNYAPEVDSRFDLGSAAHLVLLERREKDIVRVPAEDWRTKAAKEARAEAQARGEYAVLERHYHAILAMCEVAREFVAKSELGDLLDSGDAEHTVIWHEGEIACRCRPDVLSKDRRIVLDYKSTANAAPEVVGKQIGRMDYDLQAEFYTRGIEQATGSANGPVFVFLFQEITPPYACSLMALSNAYRAIGQAKVRAAVQRWGECLRTNQWPAYTDEILYVEPPAWDLAQWEGTL